MSPILDRLDDLWRRWELAPLGSIEETDAAHAAYRYAREKIAWLIRHHHAGIGCASCDATCQMLGPHDGGDFPRSEVSRIAEIVDPWNRDGLKKMKRSDRDR